MEAAVGHSADHVVPKARGRSTGRRRRWFAALVALAALAVWLPLGVTGARAADAQGAPSWSFSGDLGKGQYEWYQTQLEEGQLSAVLHFQGQGNAAQFTVYGADGATILDQRSANTISLSTLAAAGTYTWVVRAHRPLTFQLDVTGNPATTSTAAPATTAPPASPGTAPASAPPAAEPGPSPSSGSDPSLAFYVDAVAGRDDNDGRSPGTAWQTLARASAAALPPASAVLLHGGQSFAGTLHITEEDGSADGPPLSVGSYGAGVATIVAGQARGVSAYNRAVVLSDLRIVGDFAGGSDGVLLYNDLPGDVLLDGVAVSRVEISGFRGWGIALGSASGRSGYRNVVFEDLDLHGNGRGGLLTYAAEPQVHENVRVSRSHAHHNPGFAGAAGHTGNGFVLGSVQGGEVSHSSAYANGGANDVDAEGPAGIWTYHSDRVVIQFNESYDNRTGSRADGDGFDLDIGTTNSVLQYNYSHGNDGAGFLLWQDGDVASGSNTVRYNISVGDGRKNGYGGITLGGASPGTTVVHNTVVSGSGTGHGPAIALFNGPSGYVLQNNIFSVPAAATVLAALPDWHSPSVLFEGNAYHAGGGRFAAQWAGATFSTLEAWRAGTGQERSGGIATGTFADPQFVGPTSLTDAGSPGPSAYQLVGSSPLGGAAITLGDAHRGDRDFFGTPLPAGAPAAVGAHQP